MRLRHGLVPVLLLATGAPVAAGAQSNSVQMTGTVLTAISISGSDLQFGTILRTQTKTVAPAAGGSFVITLAANTNVSIDYTLPSTLGPNVTLSNWGALYNTVNDPNSALFVPLLVTSGTYTTSSPTGTMYIWIGATLKTTNAAVGSYSQPIRLTFTYN
jgi:hypothetical protein